MEFTYEKLNSTGTKTIRRTIEVTPKFDDYLEYVANQVDNQVWTRDAYDKVRKTLKWLFDNGHLVDETFDDDDGFRDYLRDAYEDSVEWPYEPDPDERDY